MNDDILFKKIITGWRAHLDLTLFIQYQKIFLKIGEIDRGRKQDYYGGLMTIGSLADKSVLQFKGMAVYDKDIYRLKQDEYQNWMLLNITKFHKAKDFAYNDVIKLSEVKEKDYIIKLLSPLETLVVNHLLRD